MSWLFAVGILFGVAACNEPAPERREQPEENAMHDLPDPRQESQMSLESAIAGRRSIRDYRDRALTDDELSQLLWAAQGITDSRRGLRAAPSAGATYPLETYAVTANGVHRYHPAEHRLEKLSDEDHRPALAAAALGQASVQRAPLVIVFSAVPERTTRRYRERGRMYIHMEAGHAAQNVHLQAVALGLGSVPIGAFDPEQAASVLGIPDQEKILYLVPVGEPL